MRYADYLAQPAQEPQEEPQAQQGQAATLDILAAQLAAEKYYSLQEEAREAIKQGQASPAAIAIHLTLQLFGTDSPELSAVLRAVNSARLPGGYDLAIEQSRQLRRQYKRQAGKLAEMLKELQEKTDLAVEEERRLIAEREAESRADGAILAVMDFSGQLTAETDAKAIITQASVICNKHGENRPAMGLLYGALTEWRERSSGTLDAVQQLELSDLMQRVASTMGL